MYFLRYEMIDKCIILSEVLLFFSNRSIVYCKLYIRPIKLVEFRSGLYNVFGGVKSQK